MKSKLFAVDYFRGLMIFWVIILHALVHRVYASDESEVQNLADNAPIWVLGILVLFALISLWGTAFSFLCGLSAAYSSAKKMQNPDYSLTKVIRDRIYAGLGLYGAYIFERTVISVLKRVAGLQMSAVPELLDLMNSSTLEAMAMWNFALAGIFYLTWRKKGYNRKRTQIVLIIIGFSILFGSLILDHFLTDVPALVANLKANQQFGLYYLFLRFYAEQFSIFPVMAYAMFGAGFGLLLADDKPFSSIRKYGVRLGIILISIGLIVIFSGYDILKGFYNTITPIPIEFLNIGLQLMLLTFLLRIFDFRSRGMSTQMKKSLEFFQAFGSLSLTIYLFEGVINSIFYNIFVLMRGYQFRGDFSLIIIYVQVNVLFWIFIIKIAKKHQNKYSIEWFIFKLKRKIPKLLKRKSKSKEHTVAKSHGNIDFSRNNQRLAISVQDTNRKSFSVS